MHHLGRPHDTRNAWPFARARDRRPAAAFSGIVARITAKGNPASSGVQGLARSRFFWRQRRYLLQRHAASLRLTSTSAQFAEVLVYKF